MNLAELEVVEKVADAVMYEGYVLYPYRASALKNRLRWQFGVVAPREYSERCGGESWHAQAECPVEPGRRPRLTVKVRCLQLQRRRIEEPIDGDPAGWRECERVISDGREFLTWDEAVPQAIVQGGMALEELCIREHMTPFHLANAQDKEVLYSAKGDRVARITRERWPVSAVLRVAATRSGDLVKVRVRVENTTEWSDSGSLDRGVVLRQSLIGCHFLLHVEDAQFVSLMDPPSHAVNAVKSCVNEHMWSVLAGVSPSRDLMLSSPIILYDYPAVAPESSGNFFDATEMDEMLTLRVMTMTDLEKREAAATDERAKVIVDRAAGSDSGNMASLHGAIRSFEELLNPPSDPSPEQAFVDVGTVRLSRGHRVRLTPNKRGDSMDMFLTGRLATITSVHRDLEDRVYVAVTLDDDPGADLRQAYGRFFYFSPDEIRPIEGEGDASWMR
jgi:hypothetical protein